MNNTNIILVGITCGVIGLYFFTGENPNNKIDENPKVITKVEDVEVKNIKKDIEIVYLEDDTEKNLEKDNANNKVTISQESIEKEKITIEKSNIDSFDNIKDPTEYIKNRELKSINMSNKKMENSEVPRYGVYANIDTQTAKSNRDKFVPPSLPIVVNSTFESGEPYSVVIDHDVYSQAQEIVITDNNPDGTINQMVRISSKNNQNSENTQVVTPPSIGN
ncbi:MAG: hypothetical protein U9Q30_05070 [Campylobacterota bacterium]|nr:hypothetical protein [Campylobacterota bacterium]